MYKRQAESAHAVMMMAIRLIINNEAIFLYIPFFILVYFIVYLSGKNRKIGVWKFGHVDGLCLRRKIGGRCCYGVMRGLFMVLAQGDTPGGSPSTPTLWPLNADEGRCHYCLGRGWVAHFLITE